MYENKKKTSKRQNSVRLFKIEAYLKYLQNVPIKKPYLPQSYDTNLLYILTILHMKKKGYWNMENILKLAPCLLAYILTF